MLKYLISKGGDINRGSIKEISGIQYKGKDGPLRVEFIHFLIKNGLKTHDRLLSEHSLIRDDGSRVGYMLYSTRLGEVLRSLN